MVNLDAPAVAKAPGHRRAWLIVGIAVVLVAGVAALTWPRTTTVKTMTATVRYADDSPHAAVLKHVHAPLGTDHWVVVVGRDPGGDYGHRVRLDATGLDAESVTVEWTANGATFVYETGHEVTVPARFFIGGR